MSPFQGRHYAKVDLKNRVILPQKLRETAEDGLAKCYLGIGFKGCLYLHARADWERVVAKFDTFSIADDNANFVMRTMMFNTVEVVPDKQSRIVIPPLLITAAGITDQKREVVILGMSRRIEIWEVGRLAGYLRGDGRSFEEVAATVL